VGLAAKPVLVFANSAGTPAIVRGAILQVTAIGPEVRASKRFRFRV
jgi:hypothetical protein